MQIINVFPKALHFFRISFNQANNVYVKIYETAQIPVLYFLNKKNIHVNFGNVLWVGCILNSIGLIINREILCIQWLLMRNPGTALNKNWKSNFRHYWKLLPQYDFPWTPIMNEFVSSRAVVSITFANFKTVTWLICISSKTKKLCVF
jgi:hypothetical protein